MKLISNRVGRKTENITLAFYRANKKLLIRSIFLYKAEMMAINERKVFEILRRISSSTGR